METLHIIGNGFDLHHNLPTSYKHFYDYLKECGEYTFINQLEMYFGQSVKGNILWSQLERGLGIYDVEGIMGSMIDEHPSDPEHLEYCDIEVEAEVGSFFEPICDIFSRLFGEWVRGIGLAGTRPMPIKHFDKVGKFLTFNYTNTLEQVYNIPKSQICHIHGDVSVKDSDFIIGHNNKFTNFKQYQEDFYDREDYQRRIAGVINGLYKDTLAIIQKHQDFFTSLHDIDKVVVYGHSLEEVDKPYFEEVKKYVRQNATWWLSIYDEGERCPKKDFCKSLGLEGCSIHTFLL